MPADLILGTAALGGQSYAGLPAISALDSIALIQRAYRLGIRDFETSVLYGEAVDRLLEALNGDSCNIYLKTDEECFRTFPSHHVVNILLHHWRQSVPRWADGFSCYSHDNVRAADGMIVQQDWNLFNQSVFPEGCAYKMARSVFLRGALAQTPHQRRWALNAALHAADGVVIGPRTIEELEELVRIANEAHTTPWIPLDVLDLRSHPMTDIRTWPQR